MQINFKTDFLYLADPGNARTCSTSIFVINQSLSYSYLFGPMSYSKSKLSFEAKISGLGCVSPRLDRSLLNSDKVGKTCPCTLILEYLRGVTKTVNDKFPCMSTKISALGLTLFLYPNPTSARARFPF